MKEVERKDGKRLEVVIYDGLGISNFLKKVSVVIPPRFVVILSGFAENLLRCIVKPVSQILENCAGR